MSSRSLKSTFAKAARRRRAIAQTKPWQPLPFGWKDRLENADHQIVLAMRAHPKRFRVQVDPHDPDTVIVMTPAHRRKTTVKAATWEDDLDVVDDEDEQDLDAISVATPTRRPTRHSRQITVRLPKAMFEIRGTNGRRGKKFKAYEPFFEEMLSRNGNG